MINFLTFHFHWEIMIDAFILWSNYELFFILRKEKNPASTLTDFDEESVEILEKISDANKEKVPLLICSEGRKSGLFHSQKGFSQDMSRHFMMSESEIVLGYLSSWIFAWSLSIINYFLENQQRRFVRSSDKRNCGHHGSGS